MNMKQIIKSIPVVGPVARRIYRTWISPPKTFPGSESYWKNRYEAGGNSGDGSYNQLAEFKADILNTFVFENEITSVIEYGCGDGNQLSLAQYTKYIGFDVSPNAISRCLKRFSNNDGTKTFKLMKEYDGETAELTLSLDVIYHLVEDDVFVDYMNRLFDSSERFVVIYSLDTDENPVDTAAHVRNRNFSKWIKDNKTEWNLIKYIPNKYPFNGDTKSGSFSDFYIYSKA
ncbi:MAG: hypothetical protein U5O15_02400 [Candidatus Krumholzibacteriota bacterium]|nr:hypothetical protein [Candidatus Krumholzibacteriota bacterium]